MITTHQGRKNQTSKVRGYQQEQISDTIDNKLDGFILPLDGPNLEIICFDKI